MVEDSDWSTVWNDIWWNRVTRARLPNYSLVAVSPSCRFEPMEFPFLVQYSSQYFAAFSHPDYTTYDDKSSKQLYPMNDIDSQTLNTWDTIKDRLECIDLKLGNGLSDKVTSNHLRSPSQMRQWMARAMRLIGIPYFLQYYQMDWSVFTQNTQYQGRESLIEYCCRLLNDFCLQHLLQSES